MKLRRVIESQLRRFWNTRALPDCNISADLAKALEDRISYPLRRIFLIVVDAFRFEVSDCIEREDVAGLTVELRTRSGHLVHLKAGAEIDYVLVEVNNGPHLILTQDDDYRKFAKQLAES